MKQTDVRNIIESALASGSKTPGIFDIPKMLTLKNKLETCTSVAAVTTLLEENRSYILNTFGLDNEVFQAAIEKIRGLA